MRKHSSSIHSPLPGEVCGEALPSFLLYQIRVREQACWTNNPGKRACHAPCFEEEAAPEIVVMLEKRKKLWKDSRKRRGKNEKGRVFSYRDLISCFIKTT
jgi:hypothetical protein